MLCANWLNGVVGWVHNARGRGVGGGVAIYTNIGINYPCQRVTATPPSPLHHFAPLLATLFTVNRVKYQAIYHFSCLKDCN